MSSMFCVLGFVFWVLVLRACGSPFRGLGGSGMGFVFWVSCFEFCFISLCLLVRPSVTAC